jgi:hypothetical protein
MTNAEDASAPARKQELRKRDFLLIGISPSS